MAKDLEGGDPSRLTNPAPASGGDGQEDMEAARSTSSRPRHKERSVSWWDYQRMVLAAFPKIGRIAVACAGLAAVVLSVWMLSQIQGPRDRGDFPPLDPTEAFASDIPDSTPTPTARSLESGGSEDPPSTPSVLAPTAETPITINFNADRYAIERGECTTLRWRVIGADVVRILEEEVEPTEAEQVCPDVTRSYELAARHGPAEQSVTVRIEVSEPSDDRPRVGCVVGYDANQQPICQVPCPGDPDQYAGTCAK